MTDANALMSVLGAIGLLILKEIISAAAGYFKSKNEAILDLKSSVKDLNHEIKRLNERIDELCRLKSDVSSLHEKIRTISSKVELMLPQ